MDIQVRSPAFGEGEMIPRQYTCTGDGVSPPIAWQAPTDSVESFALVCEDPDAPMGTFTHWVLYDLPSNVHELPERIPNEDHPPTGGTHGVNSMHRTGYMGPCPPSGTHRYFFKVFALDTRLGLEPGAGKDDLLEAMEGHVVGKGQLMGKYQRQ